jgi:hypothetical protein
LCRTLERDLAACRNLLQDANAERDTAQKALRLACDALSLKLFVTHDGCMDCEYLEDETKTCNQCWFEHFMKAATPD